MIVGIAVTFVLVTCAVIDVRKRRLPDWLTFPFLAVGLLCGALSSVTDAVWHLLGATLGFFSLYPIAKAYLHIRHQHGLGLGDAKLLAAAGAWLGPLYLAPVVLIASVLALGCVQVMRLAGRTVGWQTTLPFGPLLSAGFFACWCAKLGSWSWGA